jgi:pimeloyl-ACP methyl ester carboxylesterase
MRTSALAFGLAVLSFSLPVPAPGHTPATPFRPVAAVTPFGSTAAVIPSGSTAAVIPFDSTAAAMTAAGAPYANWIAAGRRFAEFDRSAGTAVEVLGDLAAADRIAVLVPGVNTQLADFDRGLGGVTRRAPAMQARSILSRLQADDPGARVAVVAWLGYHPPDGVNLASIRESRARSGAAALVTFVRGLLAQRPGADVTLVGHSYGAIVAGLAARDLPEVDDVVVMGAPGLGVDSAADLGGARVWSALAPTDWIRKIPQVRLFGLGHGSRPSSAGFGSIPLPTTGVAGHDYYLEPGSATLDAVADVVLGQTADLQDRS